MLILTVFLSLCSSLGLLYVCFKRRRAPVQLQMSSLVERTETASIAKVECLDSDEDVKAAAAAAVSPEENNLALVTTTQTPLTVRESRASTEAVVKYSHSTSIGCLHEVFLSFCGKDTRANFVSCLYETLTNAGIKTFRDDQGLRKGRKIEEILHAIENSKIAIPVFSRNYASREWCLRELSKIVECNQQRKQTIFPIFYDVEPWIIRDQSGLYESAFIEHQRNFPQQTVQSWRYALTEVAKISGWELQKTFDGQQGRLINTIISDVWQELGKSKLWVPNDIKRRYELENKLLKLLDLDANDVKMIGIYGEADSGKTVLAKCVYNEIRKGFGKFCSFLSDIEEKIKNNDLESLQKQLIDDLLQGNGPEKVNNIDCGISIISQRFRNVKVLLLLDNVGQKKHLDALAKERGWFGLGSRIIVTTRNKDILEDHELYGPLELPRDLLPKRVAGSTVREAATDKVFTSLMQDDDEANTSLKKQCLLYCAIYPTDTQIKRKELIDLFIHAGLIEDDRREAELERGHTILNMLENAGLLERVNTPFQESNKDLWEVKMQDSVRDKALRSKNIEFMVKAGSGLVAIPDKNEWETGREGKNLELVSLMNNQIKEISISPKCSMLSVLLLCSNPLKQISNSFFMQMPALRVLNLSFTNIKVLPKSVRELVKLVELNLRCCRELEVIPSLEKLTELGKLDLYKTAIKQVPDGLKKLVKLRCLSLSYQKKPLAFGSRNFSSYHLKDQLVKILSKLFRLHHFEAHIVIAGQEQLKQVSNCFQQWYDVFMAATSSSKARNCYVSVQNNVISGAPMYSSIYKNGRLLKTIDIDLSPRGICMSIVVSEDKGMLRMLVPSWRNLWDSNQQMLEKLCGVKVQECKELEEVIGAGNYEGTQTILNLPKLQELELLKLPRLKNISAQRRLICNSLERVKISNCPVLVSLGLLPNLVNLQELTVRKCGQLTSLIEEEEERSVDDKPLNIVIPLLASLKLYELPNLKSISGKKRLICKALRDLEIRRCPKLVSLKLVRRLKKLERLSVQDCEQLEEIIATRDGSISNETVDVPILEELILHGLPNLESNGLKWLTCNSLRRFEIQRIPLISFKLLPDVLQNLQALEIRDCEEMEEIMVIDKDEAEQYTNRIVYIGASKGKYNDSLNPIISLPELKYVWLENLPNLNRISERILVCNSLSRLTIRKCPNLKGFPFTVLSGFQNLMELEVVGCEQVEEIIAAPSDDVQGLLRDDGNINEFSLTELAILRLRKLANLKSILPKPLVCRSLKIVEIIECPHLKRIPLSQQVVIDPPCPPSSLEDIVIGTVYRGHQLMDNDEVDKVFQQAKRWWESLEWDYLNAEELFRHKVRIIGEEMLDRKQKDEIQAAII